MRNHVPKGIKRKAGILLSALAVLAAITVPSTAQALETHELIFNYSIKDNYTNKEIPVDGLKFNVYEISPDQFEKNDCVFVEMKKGFEKHLGNKVCEVTTNKEGKAVVNIKNGTFVAVPSESDKYTFLPIGLHINENVDAVITLNPKVSIKEEPKTPENPPSDGSNPPPKTFDPTDLSKAALFTLIAGAVIFIGVKIKNEVSE